MIGDQGMLKCALVALALTLSTPTKADPWWLESYRPLFSQRPPNIGQPKQPAQAARQNDSAGDQRGTDGAPLAVKVMPAKKTSAEEEKERYEGYEKPRIERSMAGLTLLLAVIAGIQAWMFLRQLKFMGSGLKEAQVAAIAAKDAASAAKISADAAQDQVDISRQSLVYSQRAFINASRFDVLHLRDTSAPGPNPKIIGWQITPIWENSGNTPTKKLNIITGIRGSEFPKDFEFKIDHGEPTLIGPKAVLTGTSCSIPLAEAYKIKDGLYKFYIWGRAEYNDVFPGTKRHYTNFCRQIVFIGDPTVADCSIGLLGHSIGNYSDEDQED